MRRYGATARLRKAAAAAALILAALPAQAGMTIAALGDSLTQGYGLPMDQGFVPRLESWLQARGHAVQVLNAGVSGDTTAGGLSRVGWTLAGDVDAMIVALGANDMLRAVDPAVSRANLEGILSAADQAGVPVLLVGIGAPGNYGPAYKRDFEAMYPDLAAAHDALLVPDFLAGLRAARDAGADPRALMQADGMHPSAEGVERIVATLGPAVEQLIARVRSAP